MMVPLFMDETSLTSVRNSYIISETSVSKLVDYVNSFIKMGQIGRLCIVEIGYAVERITDGLLELLEEKPFAAITVSEIVRRAEVGRASFYRHFDSKDAVICGHMKMLLKEWGREFETTGKLEDLGPSLLRHFYGHKNFYLLLYQCGLSHYLLDSIRDVMELDGKTEQEVYPLSWFAGGVYGLVEEWMRRGMNTSPDEMEAMSRG